MRYVYRILSLAGIILAMNGCSTVRDLAKAGSPSVVVTHARVTGLSFDAVDLVVALRVSNPNAFALPVAGLDYDVTLDNRSVLTGSRPQSVTVPGHGSLVIDLPISLRFRELYASLGSLGGRDEAPYRVSGGLTFDIPVAGPVRVPVRHTGSLPLVRLPRIALGGLRVRDLSLRGATMDLVLGIDNPNAFDLGMQRIDYTLAINGSPWASGQSHRTDSIPRKQRGELRIPVTLDFLRIGSGIYELVRGSPEVSYRLEGSLQVGTSLPLLRGGTLPMNETGTIRLTR